MLKGTLEWHLNTCQRREPVTGAADRRVSGRRRWDNGDGQTEACSEQVGGTRVHGAASGVWSADRAPGGNWNCESSPGPGEWRVSPASRAHLLLGVGGRRPAWQRSEETVSPDASGPPQANHSLGAMERGQGTPGARSPRPPPRGEGEAGPARRLLLAGCWLWERTEKLESSRRGTGAWGWLASSRVQYPAPPTPSQ